jgi:GNAT superfamily N-acetyltransferase
MIVRLALESEEDIFVELSRAAVEESASHIPFVADAVRETFKQYLDTANPTIFFAEQRGDVVGFLLATMSGYRFSDGFYTTQEVMFVRPDKRGTRAAALLVRELVRWSDQLGALEITGGNDNNLFTEQTARLLGHFGFERVGIFMRRVGVPVHG